MSSLGTLWRAMRAAAAVVCAFLPGSVATPAWNGLNRITDWLVPSGSSEWHSGLRHEGGLNKTLRRWLAEGGGEGPGVLAPGCEISQVGCFSDGDNCAGGVQDCRSLQYGVAGCSGPGTTPAPSPSPTCDQLSLTNENCLMYCYDWFKDVEGGLDEVFSGTNNGECYCDLEYDPGEQNGLCGGSCPESTSGCNIPCAGDTSEMCGSAWFNMVYKVECSGGAAAWTWPFIIGFCAIVAVYLGGGMFMNNSAGKSGKDMIPHTAMWTSLAGLVGDGLAFTMGHQPATTAAAAPLLAGEPPTPTAASFSSAARYPVPAPAPYATQRSVEAVPLAADTPRSKLKKKKKPTEAGESPKGEIVIGADGKKRRKKVKPMLALADDDGPSTASAKKKKKKRPQQVAGGME